MKCSRSNKSVAMGRNTHESSVPSMPPILCSAQAVEAAAVCCSVLFREHRPGSQSSCVCGLMGRAQHSPHPSFVLDLTSTCPSIRAASAVRRAYSVVLSPPALPAFPLGCPTLCSASYGLNTCGELLSLCFNEGCYGVVTCSFCSVKFCLCSFHSPRRHAPRSDQALRILAKAKVLLFTLTQFLPSFLSAPCF